MSNRDTADPLDSYVGVCTLEADEADDPRRLYLDDYREDRRRMPAAWFRVARSALHDLGHEYGWRSASGERLERPRFGAIAAWAAKFFDRGEADGRASRARYEAMRAERDATVGADDPASASVDAATAPARLIRGGAR